MINVSLNSSGESSFINKIFGRFKSLNRSHRPLRSATTKVSSNFQLILRNFACSYISEIWGELATEVLHGSHVVWQEQWNCFALERTFVPIGKIIYCFCHATWLPCKTSIAIDLKAVFFPWRQLENSWGFRTQAVGTTQYHSPASRNLSAVIILDVSHLKDNVKLELAGSKNTFAATTCTKNYIICLLDLRRRVSDWRILTMAHLTRPAVISGVSAGSFPETAAENRA